MDQVETYGAPTLTDVQFNSDGSLKQSGKQNVKFRWQKRLSFKAKIKKDDSGVAILDEVGKVIPVIDPKTGIPFKEAFDETVIFVRIETKGDTNIYDDVATEFHKRQFYPQFKFFYEGKTPDGRSIEEFDFFYPAVLMELHMLGIHTLEQVAEMNPLECQQVTGQSGYELKDIAAQWLKINSPQGQSARMTKQDQEIIELKRQLSELQKNQRGFVPTKVEASSQIEEAPVATMEVNIKDKPRKV